MREVEPSFQSINHFSVSIYYTDPGSLEKIEVVRIDNSHGYVHMDQLFREGEPKQEMSDLDAFTAYDFLKDNWKKFARKHAEKK